MGGADRGRDRASPTLRGAHRSRADAALRRKRSGHQCLFPRSRRLADGIYVIRRKLIMAEAPGTHNPNFLPPDITAPQDDGAARHLTGMKLPSHSLPATSGPAVDLSQLRGRPVLYIYPRTGVPGVDAPPGWDQIPGARGCTPQSCGFRDHFADLKALGVAQVFGLSAQDTGYQREAAERLHLPFPILSDAGLNLATGLHLPMFMTSGMTLLARIALVIEDGTIVKVFYPVFPPDKSAEEVVAWLRNRPA